LSKRFDKVVPPGVLGCRLVPLAITPIDGFDSRFLVFQCFGSSRTVTVLLLLKEDLVLPLFFLDT
jgi:hypothetical protein